MGLTWIWLHQFLTSFIYFVEGWHAAKTIERVCKTLCHIRPGKIVPQENCPYQKTPRKIAPPTPRLRKIVPRPYICIMNSVNQSLLNTTWTLVFEDKEFIIQLTLVISNSLISNNRLCRCENLVPVLTQRSTNRQQNIVGKRRNCSLGAISPLFHNILNIISNLGVKLKIHSVKGSCWINCFPQFRKSDMSKFGYLEVLHRVPWISR